MLARLRAQEPDTTCPTCGRPIEGNDIAITVGLFESKLEGLALDRAKWTTESSISATEALETGVQIKALDERIAALDTLSGRIQDGSSKIAETDKEFAAQESELASHLKATGLNSVPDQVAIDSANRRLAVARKLAGTLPMLRRLETDALRTVDDRDALVRDIDAIGEVHYDQVAHDRPGRS